MAAHSGGGHPARAWGGGAAAGLAGPYRDLDAYADLAGLLATRGLDNPALPLGNDRDRALLAAVASEVRDLSGPHGGAHLLLARLADERGSTACPEGRDNATADPRCLRAPFSDALKAGWYDAASHAFFHVGDTTTVYRPVEAIAVGCALVVSGLDGVQDEDKISAGMDIIKKEMESDFDQHYGLVYGLMTANPGGGRQPLDTNTRVADQAGIAEMLLQAFDASRERQLQEYARVAMAPLLDDTAGLATARGYISGFDLKSSPPANPDVDVEAGVLVLQAAHHYDVDDGNLLARVEETAARGLLAAATVAGAADGLPGALTAAGPTMRSGLVTALGVLALTDVLAIPRPATAAAAPVASP
jgi:hypothetical protein